ncbi:MAG: hypothetical protein A3J29_09275 [Acidobacteria bacterium RIFCSPLOWO2_12_FULL_67_14b]|nr:MAG: hypothetical protein A3J29_09275 [Acidobacteria bacterium RIFCSPLOWO2_12_FULL_67_14b]
MKRSVLIALFALAIAAPSFADVTVKAIGSGKGMGISGNMATTTYIKGNKMRTETITGDTTRTMIFDVDSQRLFSFDSKKKEADAWDMQAFGENISKSVDTSAMKASVKPNGQTKQIAGRNATGYDMSIELPAMLGGAGGMKMTVMLEGPMWVVKGAPGTAEYIAFYKGAVEKGWIFSDPRGAKGSPGQAKAMAEMYKQLAETGGIPYETEMSIKMGGDGPMAGMMAKMGGMTSTSTVQSVETGTLAADLFAPPAGYKIKEQK